MQKYSLLNEYMDENKRFKQITVLHNDAMRCDAKQQTKLNEVKCLMNKMRQHCSLESSLTKMPSNRSINFKMIKMCGFNMN